LAVPLLLACSSGEERPDAWGDLRLADGDACPTLIGRYLVDDGPAAFLLGVRHLPDRVEPRVPVSFAVEAQDDSTLTVSVRDVEGEDSRTTMRRGSEWGGSYYCEDGWLRFTLDGGRSRWDSLARPGGHVAKRRSLRLAPARDGALIARLDAHWFEGIQPYAPGSGDGIPIPWTWKRAHAWWRTEPFTEAALARRQAQVRAARSTPPDASSPDAPSLDAVRADPVWQANEALEHPLPAPGQRAVAARLQALAPAGVHVLAVAPRDSGWHVSVAYADPARLTQLFRTLAEQDDMRAVQHDALVRGQTAEGMATTAVYVRLATARP
jgi:hypothetical protein